MHPFQAAVLEELQTSLAARGFRATKLVAPQQALPTVTFCGSFDRVVSEAPDAPWPEGYELGTGQCYDIVVTGSLEAGVTDVRVEGADLSALVPVELGSGVAADLDAVHRGLGLLFPTPAARSSA